MKNQKLTKMQADINGNPVPIEFEDFKKLDLSERRLVLFSLLKCIP